MSEFELTELYKGKVQLKFFPGSHQYWVSVNGSPFKRKTGSTTYIGIKDKSRPLGIWQQELTAGFLFDCIKDKVKIDEEKAVEAVIQCEIAKDKAADIGSEIHAWIEGYIRHKLKQPGFENLPDMPKYPEAIIGTNSFFEWEKKHKVKFLSTETPVYSLEHDYCGIEDFTAIIDDEFTDNDFKTSNGLYNGVRAQTASYAMARMENGGRKTQGRWAIRLAKYDEKEYMKRELRKKEIKKIIAKIKGVAYKESEIRPYEVFEAKYLDDKKSFIERDFKAFLNMKAIHEWDKETDPFYQKENW
jgi:hypothetical protein